MKHSVAVGTNGPQVLYGINQVRATFLGDGCQVMNLDVLTADFAISLFEGESTNSAAEPMMKDAGLSRS